MDAKSVRNMQSNIAVTNKHTAKLQHVGSFIYILYMFLTKSVNYCSLHIRPSERQAMILFKRLSLKSNGPRKRKTHKRNREIYVVGKTGPCKQNSNSFKEQISASVYMQLAQKTSSYVVQCVLSAVRTILIGKDPTTLYLSTSNTH